MTHARGGDGGSGVGMHDSDGMGGNQMPAAEGGGEKIGNQMRSKDFHAFYLTDVCPPLKLNLQLRPREGYKTAFSAAILYIKEGDPVRARPSRQRT